MPIRKKSGNLFNDPRIYRCVCVFLCYSKTMWYLCQDSCSPVSTIWLIKVQFLLGSLNSAAKDIMKQNRVRKIVAENQIQSANQVVLYWNNSCRNFPRIKKDVSWASIRNELNIDKIAADVKNRLSGYTIALLSSVIKLSPYLRETEEKKLQTKIKARKLLATEISG